MRLALTLEYDGTAFFGFQTQVGQRTVQGELERALTKATGETIRVTAAGRTDTGVHALGQVVSFSTDSRLLPETLVKAINFYLPEDVAVLGARRVPAGFNARRSARGRHYRYLILCREVRSPLRLRRAWRVAYRLDVPAMQAAGQMLQGEHDFASFAAVDTALRSTVRLVKRVDLRAEDDLLVFEIEANAFLPHQVRHTVGALLEVGRGRLAIEEWSALLERKSNRQAGPAAPPHGLYLVRVDYPEEELDS